MKFDRKRAIPEHPRRPANRCGLFFALWLAFGVIACQSPLPLIGGASQDSARAAEEPPAAPPRPSEDSLFQLSDADFRRLQAARQPIDVVRIDYTLLAAAIFHESNRQRRQHGRSLLDNLQRLNQVAAMHAQDMVRQNFFDHENPRDARKRTLQDRLLLFELLPRFAAENIAHTFAIQYEAGRRYYKVSINGIPGFSYTPGGPAIPPHSYQSFAEGLVTDWMNSPGHRQNLLSQNASFLGCGCELARMQPQHLDQIYCVQVFFQ